MAQKEVIEHAHVEADRLAAARQAPTRAEDNAVVGEVLHCPADQPIEVAAVLGQDRSPLCRHELKELLVAQPFELRALLHRDHVVPTSAKLLGDLLRVELVQQEPHEARSSCPARQSSSARAAASISRAATSSTSSLCAAA